MRPFLAVVLTTATLAVAAPAQRASAQASAPAESAEERAFGERVRAYLLSHPEVLIEAMQILQARQEKTAAENVKQAIIEHRQEISHDPASPVGGNPQGNATLVEFFDYNCSYCRAVAPTIAAILAADPKLRFVYKEFPILGPSSEFAARAALAAQVQGEYAAFHDALMKTPQPLSEERILETAAAVGIDTERLKRDMADPAIGEAIARNHALAAALGIDGTPAFIIGDQVVPGAVDRATLEGLIAEARKGGGAGP